MKISIINTEQMMEILRENFNTFTGNLKNMLNNLFYSLKKDKKIIIIFQINIKNKLIQIKI